MTFKKLHEFSLDPVVRKAQMFQDNPVVSEEITCECGYIAKISYRKKSGFRFPCPNCGKQLSDVDRS